MWMPRIAVATVRERSSDSELRRMQRRGYAVPMPATLLVPLDLSPIQVLLRLIEETWAPLTIWLFGSRARGQARADSDWDLLVVVPDEVAAQIGADPLAGWNLRRRAGVRADVIVCGESDFREGSKVPNTLAYEAAHEGILIYEH